MFGWKVVGINMKIGFTGTKRGMSCDQYGKFKSILKEHPYGELHHGDCIGSDYEAHILALFLKMAVIVHPPINPKSRAFCGDSNAPGAKVSILNPKEYLERNHDIVDTCDILIATPAQSKEVLRSGTWATIRYARKNNKQVIIIEP